jgi:Ca2+-binding RTX toxin-like protein
MREIVTPAANNAWVDTAVYAGVLADYDVQLVDDVWTITDINPDGGGVGPALDEGTDTLFGVERVQFADTILINNDVPIGSPAIDDMSPTQGQLLTASLGNIEDAQGIDLDTVSFTWEAEVSPDNWVSVGGGETFTPGLPLATLGALGGAQVGQRLRVVVDFTDNLGTAEQVIMEGPTQVVGDFYRANGGAQNFNGTEGADDVDTGGGAETLTGNGGDDTMNGGLGNDTLLGGAGNDSMLGGGNGGADRMDGGAGADTMVGGAGNDVYVAVELEDVIVEDVAVVGVANTDTIQTALNVFTLEDYPNIERLEFVGGVGDFTGTGNALANRIAGNGGNDTLDGLGGVDTMVGGNGNDTYIVDNASDVTTEANNGAGGIDHVFASVSDTLQASVENLTLTGAGPINGTGNALANVITGNDAVNSLSGAGGDDTLVGLGDGDVLSGAAGNDTLFGGDGSDNLSGGAGQDHLYGGAGNDVMNGNGDSDTFHFEAAESFGIDTIAGLDLAGGGVAQDYLDLSDLGITATTFGGAVTWSAGANSVILVTALDEDSNVVELGRINTSVNGAQIGFDDFILAPG